MHTRTTLPPCKTERRAAGAPRARTRMPAPAAATFAASLGVGALSTALAGPTGGVVVEGQGSISTPSVSSTVIDQASQHLQLNWSSFNVGASESVQFNQPSSTAVALNRILDQNPSQIFGSVKANGQVVLVNPNGLLIGRTAQLNVNSLVVSSLDAIDFDAASGRYRFSTSRNDIGAILNEGSITAGPGGSVTLLGGRVGNSGTIVADLGTVNLAAGRAATLDLAGDGLLRLEVNSNLLSNSGGSSAVENSGSIQANGGQVLLTANAVKDVFANLINNTGVVRANRIENSGGSIRLVGPEGIVQSSGTLDASAGDAVSTGGSVAMLGDRVGLTGSAVIDVSGATGGGTALIGGDYQGKNPDVLNATRTYVGSGVTLDADAGSQGDGGRIIVWSDGATHYEGQLSARGGSLWGNGGFAEVSGKQTLTFAGTASLRAAHGQWGMLLLDPGSITIEDSNDPPPSGITSPGDLDWATGENPGSQTIGNQTIENLLLDGSLALHATNNISQNADAPINVSGQAGANGNSLTLEAVNGNITLRAGISTRNGDIILQAGNDIVMQNTAALSAGTGDISLTADGNIQTRTITGRAVSLDAGGDILDNGGTGLSAILGLTLHADRQIGELTDLLTLAGNTPVRVVTAGSVDATVDDADGLINLRLPSSTLPGGLDVTLGSGVNRTGTVFLQSSGLLNLSGYGAGAIKIGNGQTATVALMSGSVLTLPAAGNLIDQSPGTLFLRGDDIVDSDAGAASHDLTLDAQNLRFEAANPTASKLLTTTATRFDGVFGSSNTLTVRNFGAPLTIGSVTAPSASVTLQGQRLLDDGDINTVIEGSQVILSGQAVGTSANPMNTRAALLGATAAQGGIHIVEQDGVLLLGATAVTGGAGAGIVNIRTLDGAMEVLDANADTGVFLETAENIASASGITLSGNIQGNGAGVLLRTNGSGDGITLNGNILNGGAISLTAGSPISRGAITGSGLVDGSSLTLLAASAGTGTSGRIHTSAGNLNITTTNAAQGAYIDATNGVTALTATASGVLDVRATNGSIATDSVSAGQGVFLQTDGPGQSVTVKGGATVSGSVGGVSLNAAGVVGNIVVNGDVGGNGPGVQMTTGTAGNITVNGNVSSTTAVNLTAGTPGSRGDIIAGAGSIITVTGGTGLLTATGHSIGSSGARLRTNAIALNATAENGGNIYVDETSGLDLTASATGGGTVDVEADGVLRAVGTVSGNGVVLKTNGGGSNINVTGALTGNGGFVHLDSSAGVALTGAGLVNNVGGNVELDAVGAVTAQANTNRIIANQLTANAASIGTSSARLFTEVGALTTTTTSAAAGAGTYITEFDAVALDGEANGGVLDVETTNGALDEFAANGGSGVRLVAGQGSLTIMGAVTGGTGPVTLAASAAGGIINLNNTVSTSGAAGDVTITAGTPANRGALNLNATSVTGDEVTIDAASIGVSGAPLQTTARTLTASTTTGGIFVRDTDGLTVNSATATVGEVNIETQNGALSVGATAGDGVTLTTSGANNTIITTGAIDGRAGVVQFATNGTSAGIAVNGGITTSSSVSLFAAGGGNIGLNSTIGSGDNVLAAASAGGISTGGAVTAANDVVLLASGGIALGGAVTAGNIAVLDAGGDITSTAGSVGAIDLTLTGNSIGAPSARINTSAGALHAASAAGGIFITEADAVTLDASATGGAVDVQAGGALTLGAVTATNGASLTSGGANQDFNVDQAVNAGSGALVLATTGAGSAINLNAAVNAAGPVTVNAGGAGGSIALNNSVTTPGAVTLTAGTVGNRGNIAAGAGVFIDSASLTATGASIGTSSARLSTRTGTLTATAEIGGIFVSELDALTLTGTNAAGVLDVQTNGALDVSSSGGNGVLLTATGAGNAINVNGAVNGGTGNISLLADGDGSSINLAGAVSTSGDVSLTAGTLASRGAIDTSLGGGSVTANALTAVGSSIGSSGIALATTVNSLDATATNGTIRVAEANGLDLTANASGAVEVSSASGPVRVSAVSANGVDIAAAGAGTLTVDGPVNGGSGPVELTALGNMTLNGAVTTSNAVALNGGDGTSITLNSAVSGSDVQISIGSASARGALVAGAGNQINANNLFLTTAGVGDSSSRLNTAVSSIDAQSSSGGIYVTEADALTLEALAQGGGAVDVRTLNGALDVTSVAAQGVTLATGGDGNALTVNGALGVGVQGGGASVSLTTSGAGSNIVLNAPVLANPNVTVAANGDGSSVILNDVIGAGSLSITAGSAANRGAIVGSATSNLAAASVTLVGSSIGSSGTRLNTAADTLTATSSNGGIFLSELDAVGLTANATGGAVDVETLGSSGALTVAAAVGDGVTLKSGSLGGINVTGAVNGGAGPVTLTTTTLGGAIALNAGVTTSGAVTLNTGGAITAGAGGAINGASLTATGSAIGTSGARLNTNVASLNAMSTGGDIFVTEANALTLNATSSNAVDVRTTNGALTVTGATGTSIALTAGGAGSGIAMNGALNAGNGDVALTAGGAISTGAGGRVSGRTLTAEGSSIGSTSAPLNTTIVGLVANATAGDVGISELDGLALTNVRATGNVGVTTASGDIAVSTVSATNDAALTAASGAITDDADDTTRLAARNVTLLARSIGGASTLAGTTLDSRPRLDLDATSLDATTSAGGIFIDELNGLTSVRVHASGAGSDIELLTATGDLNLQSVSASDTLLLAAGGNINVLSSLGPVTARTAELRAGGADATAGHIGTLSAPLTLQLDAGNTLRLFVPQTVNPTDATRAPATLPSTGVVTTLSLFGAPNPLSVQAGFGQFTGLGDSQFTSPAESLVRTIQNQTTNVQTVLGLDWASFDPNVSLFGTLDPSVCLPADQRDEEKGDSGC